MSKLMTSFGDLLLEFKPSITDLNAVLFQALRYLFS